jgi:hexulose-6-phosphate isomerase
MKIGINRWTMPDAWPLAECFAQATRAGFDSIEINIADEGELTPTTTQAEVEAIAASAASAGIELSSLSTGLGWKHPLTSGDTRVRQSGKENIRRQLEVAEWLGLDTILVVPGIVDAETGYDEAYGRAQDALKELAEEAEGRRVAIGVENVWNKFLLSPLEFARFLDEIGSEYVGAYFDVGNVLVYGYPDQWIRILGSRIRKIHVKDFKANIGNISAFCNPLQGQVPWERVRHALDAIGYDSYVTAEVDGYTSHEELGLKHIAESLRAVFSG